MPIVLQETGDKNVPAPDIYQAGFLVSQRRVWGVNAVAVPGRIRIRHALTSSLRYRCHLLEYVPACSAKISPNAGPDRSFP